MPSRLSLVSGEVPAGLKGAFAAALARAGMAFEYRPCKFLLGEGPPHEQPALVPDFRVVPREGAPEVWVIVLGTDYRRAFETKCSKAKLVEETFEIKVVILLRAEAEQACTDPDFLLHALGGGLRPGS